MGGAGWRVDPLTSCFSEFLVFSFTNCRELGFKSSHWSN